MIVDSPNKSSWKYLFFGFALVVACGYFVVSSNSFEATPDDVLHQEIMEDLRSAHPMAVNTSPNGEYVLTKSESESGFQLCIKEVESSKEVLTSFSKNTQRSLTWRPDSKAIVYQETIGSDRPLYLLDLESGKKKELKVPVSQTGMPPLRWDPAGKRIAYFAGDWRTGDLLVFDAESGTPPSVVQRGMSGTCDFVWSPDGKHLATMNAADPGVVTLFNLNDLKSTRLTIAARGQIETLAWSPLGDSILVTARRAQDEYFKLFEVFLQDPSVKLGVTDKRVLLRAEAKGNIGNPVWFPDGKTFVYHVLLDGLVQAVAGDRTTSFIQHLGPTNGVIRITHLSQDGTRLYGRFAPLTEPPKLISISMETAKWKVLYSLSNYNSNHFPVPESISIASFDGTMIPAYHWKAPNAGSPRAVLIEVHGGMHTQTFPTWESYIHIMAKHGIDVIAVNYRGSSGYGRSFEETGDDHARVRDVVAARDYAVNVLKADPGKVFLMGTSRGAGLAAGAALQGQEIGVVFLISWAGASAGDWSAGGRAFEIVGFQGETDPFFTPKEARDNVQKHFSPKQHPSINARWYRMPDEGHFFYKAESWASVWWEIVSHSRKSER